MRLTSTIPFALLAGLILTAVAPRAAQPRAGSTPPLSIEHLIDIKHPSNPVWSRDSRRIAFTWERTGVANLFVVPADGSAKPVQLTTDGVPGNVFWSHDSKTLLFFRGGSALTSLPLDGTPPVPLGFAARSPSVSRDGTKIVYLAAAGAIRVRSLVDGSDALVATVPEQVQTVSWITDTQLALSTGGGRGETLRHEQTPEYSGSKIIYTVTQRTPGAPAGTWVLPISGGSPKPYSALEGGGAGGRGGRRWVDATHFLIDRQSPDFKRRSIFVGSIEGGEPKLVHEDVKEKFWSMTGDARAASQASPDGKWISFVSDRDGWDHIYVAPSGGGTPVQITKGQYEAWRYSWSPDGTQIAFDSNEGANPGNRQIRVVSMTGNPSRETIQTVTKGRGTNTDPVWSPNGALLVYQHTDPQNSADLYVVDVTKPAAAQIRLTNSMPVGATTPVGSPWSGRTRPRTSSGCAARSAPSRRSPASARSGSGSSSSATSPCARSARSPAARPCRW